MNNYPPGVTAAMIDRHFGGPEDEILSISADQDREIEVSASATHVFLSVCNWREGTPYDDYTLTKGEARALARYILDHT